MGFAEDITGDWHAALAALALQVEAGVDEALGDAPVDWFAVGDTPAPALPKAQSAQAAPLSRSAAPPVPLAPAGPAPGVDAVAIARAAAQSAATLEALRDAALSFDLCELKKGARNTVFSDGNPRARVLILGEAPGREEDLEGRPFVGRAGQLLDRMFAAIGLSRSSPDAEAALYITNVMFWRPPGNRDPEEAEIAMMKPFVERHIELVDPAVIVAFGNTPLAALTGTRGILRARGTWTTALGRPLMPMIHPAYLLRNPLAKREAWVDLQAIRERLNP